MSLVRSLAGSMVKPLASAITGASGGEDTYAANGFSPDYVADFSAASADYFRVAGNDSDFETAFTSDSEGGGLATQVDSSGNLVWRAHNLLAYSAQFDNAAWNKTNASVSADVSIAPDGTTTADRITDDATNGEHRVAIALDPPTDQDVTYAVFAKYENTQYVYIGYFNEGAVFDIQNGATGTSNANVSSSSITAVGNGWYLCSAVINKDFGVDAVYIGLSTTDAYRPSYAGGSGSALVWGAHAYRSDLGGMADNPDAAAGLEKYVPTTTAARYLARRRHHRWDGSAWVPTCLHEPVGATNLDPNSDDLSAWTTSNTTIAKNQTGADGVANSAHSITATANSGTALEQITAASAAHAWGCLMKRITGTGTVEVTVDGGSTWVDITSDLSTSVFLQVSTGAGITVTNPEFGVRLGTSGDVVAVQVSQLEQTSGFISSPIPTNGSTVARTADTLKGKAASLPYSSTAMSMAMKGRVSTNDPGGDRFISWQQAANNRILAFGSTGDVFRLFSQTAAGSAQGDSGALSEGVNVAFRVAGRVDTAGNEIQSAEDGAAGTATAYSLAMPTVSGADMQFFAGGGTSKNAQIDTFTAFDENIAEAGIEEALA